MPSPRRHPMTERVRQLRVQVRKYQRGRPARSVPYPDGLRREIEANLADACDRGIPVARGAGELGVPPSTLTLWRRRAAGGPFRPVALTAPAPAIAPLRLTVSELQLLLEGSTLVGRLPLSPAPFVLPTARHAQNSLAQRVL